MFWVFFTLDQNFDKKIIYLLNRNRASFSCEKMMTQFMHDLNFMKIKMMIHFSDDFQISLQLLILCYLTYFLIFSVKKINFLSVFRLMIQQNYPFVLDNIIFMHVIEIILKGPIFVVLWIPQIWNLRIIDWIRICLFTNAWL